VEDLSARRATRAHAYENPRPEVQALVPRDARRIADLGCASGALGAALRARQGCHVTGVEADPAYAAAARERLDAVVEGDLETLGPPEGLRCDCLVAADVLEHLRDPWAVLARWAAAVQPGGAVVVSLPNVRHWETFWALGVRGTWPRRSAGLFDATHLRWFTLADAWALLEGAGLQVEAVARIARPGSRLGARVPPAPGLRALLTYQHVLRARAPARPS
jgi:SAM-dependent methyltransferase